MGKCLPVSFVVSGIVLAGLTMVLYTPLPPDVANWWQMQKLNARIKAGFIFGELRYRAGLSERFPAVRAGLNYTLYTPMLEADRDAVETYDTIISGVPVRVYRSKSNAKPLPGLIFIHGGGWSSLDVAMYDIVCAHIARMTDIAVISVEYRLAPEFPFPAGFDDCLGVVKHALQHGAEMGLDPSRIAVGGDSSGGNLAAALSLHLRNEKISPPLKAQVLLYACYQFCDNSLPVWKKRRPYAPEALHMFSVFFGNYFNMTESQRTLLASGRYVTPQLQKKCNRLVDFKLLPKELIPEGHVPEDQAVEEITKDVLYINSLLDDPKIAPLMEEDLTRLPTSFVMAVGWDALRDENIILAERLKAAGNKVKLVFIPETFHGIIGAYDYDTFGFDAGPKAMKDLLEFIKRDLKG